MSESVVIQETYELVEVTELHDSGVEVVREISGEVGLIEQLIEGPPGEPGPSAYEVAVANGFVGTEAEWLVSLSVAGPPGPSGGDLSYEHTQNNPSDTWGPISHGLGKLPSYGAVDSAGNDMEVGITHIDLDNCYLTFAIPTSGKGYFN